VIRLNKGSDDVDDESQVPVLEKVLSEFQIVNFKDATPNL
jgi:hypothetical protein